MEFWITIVGLARRKRVIFPALLIAFALGAVAYAATPVRYSSSTTMVLTTTQFGGSESQDPSQPTSLTNPMLNFNDSLRTTAGILIEAMSTKDVAAASGVTGKASLTVNDGRTNPNLLGLNGPFVYVEGTSTSPAQAQAIVLRARDVMRMKLKAWQSSLNAPQKTYLSLAEVVAPGPAEPSRSRATKLGLVGLIAGFLLSMGIAYFGHGLSVRRRARAAAPRPAVTSAPPLEGRPGGGRVRRPSRAPVLVPEKDADAVTPTSLKIGSRTT